MGNSDIDRFSEIKKIILIHARVDESSLHLGTRIGEDLCITGDDAYEFLEDYMNKFDVDLSESSEFCFGEYFPDEVSADECVYIAKHSKCKVMKYLSYIAFWSWITCTKNRQYKSMTIQDLLDNAEKGVWKN